MILTELLAGLPVDAVAISGPNAREITALIQDSRNAGPGAAFFCIVGFGVDGHDYIDAAIAAGARVIIAERPPAALAPGITWITVPSTRVALAEMARVFHGDPSASLPVLAVTGTNGKTSVVWILDHILRQCGHRPDFLGTVASRIGGVLQNTLYTTPPAHELQAALATMRKGGATEALIEASSHGLELGRTAGITVAVGAFTNLSRDHLEFHETMAAYADAKWHLFSDLSQRAVFNIDDATGATFAARWRSERRGPVICVGTGEGADLRAHKIVTTIAGSSATIETPEGPIALNLRMVGDYNVSNALVAVAMASQLGVPLRDAAQAVAGATGAPGRLEMVDADAARRVVVDYAHTPDALRATLTTLRPLTEGALICVFGAGGDRDPGKRPEMGRAAVECADRVIITSDNPRTEDPDAIIDAIMEGIAGRERIRATIIADRAAAIDAAIAQSAPGDVIVIAGKGHEDYQIVGTERLAFDDRVEARRALSALSPRGEERVQ